MTSKLTEEDLEILGLDLEDYSQSSIDQLLKWECSFDNTEFITCEECIGGMHSCPPYALPPRELTYIAVMMFKHIHYICLNLNLIDKDFSSVFMTTKEYTYEMQNYTKEYEKIIKGTIELREKRQEIKPLKSYLGAASVKIEGAEIPDDELGEYNSPKDVIEILRERNIKRLEKLFKEQETKGEDDEIN
jgi:hypothetical protein